MRGLGEGDNAWLFGADVTYFVIISKKQLFVVSGRP
jgi:hypothetical protein